MAGDTLHNRIIESEPKIIKENQFEPSNKEYRIVKVTYFECENFRVEKRRRFLFWKYWSLLYNNEYSQSTFSTYEAALICIEREIFKTKKQVVSYHP